MKDKLEPPGGRARKCDVKLLSRVKSLVVRYERVCSGCKYSACNCQGRHCSNGSSCTAALKNLHSRLYCGPFKDISST
jgi:hypothetical protein